MYVYECVHVCVIVCECVGVCERMFVIHALRLKIHSVQAIKTNALAMCVKFNHHNMIEKIQLIP